MQKAVIDTGVFIALFNRDDEYHKNALAFVQKEGIIFFTTEAVITEVLYIFHKKIDVQYDFLKLISESDITIVSFSSDDYTKIADLMKEYSDLPMDYADATIVQACDKISSNFVATVDSDFEIYKFKGTKRFSNLMGT